MPTNHEMVARLAAVINVNLTLAALLFQRGIRTYEEARHFFRPSLEHLHDPFLMKDMDRAVARLDQALRAGERILVYGDYDVDGTTSVALFYGFLKSWWSLPATHFQYYIPDRYAEGYGVSSQGVDWAHQHGFTLIVCLDCGIKSADKVDYAKTLGIDFIICDHHQPDARLPDAAAVLDPKRSDCFYPFDGLSGCGVGFKFLQAHCQQQEIPFEELYPFLDLVVVSIAADIVPMVGENRVLAYFGLQQLNTSPRPGLRALMQIAGCTHFRDISSVVFGLGPRINAAGRVAHAKVAVQLLLADTPGEATAFARQINLNNTSRRDLDAGTTQEALQMIAGDETLLIAKSTVLFKPDWSKGVIGIVASRCIEKYHRPTIILTESQGKAAGSARSVPGFDVYEAIEECADLLEQFGGHMYAAGLSLKLENVPAFRRKFEEVVARRILPEQLTPLIEVDLNLNLAQITPKFYGILQRMSPFGPQNMPPTFVSERVRLQGEARVLKEQHLKLCVFQEGSSVMEAIGFGMAHFYPRLNAEEPFQICYQITENDFRGSKSLQLHLCDIKFGEGG
ncbi:MAG: single-stranded-DNA-specific exonuclease RecJ [Ferruginibacter sp.]|nr:single-stranded-DNA-specific exonuclease RecJ [Cytophagales bacterium]